MNIDNQNKHNCNQYVSHCAKSKNNYHCMFCDLDMNGNDFDSKSVCNVAISQKIYINHEYQVEHINGFATNGQDYVQNIGYRCVNCDDMYFERDDQR